jgi:hypothetical protein
MDACHSPTQSEFDQEWEVAYAKWLKEQEVEDSGNVEVGEPKIEAAGTRAVEVDLCERDVESNCS